MTLMTNMARGCADLTTFKKLSNLACLMTPNDLNDDTRLRQNFGG
jgi:hypothetical protein